jgi:acylphosphatase
VNEGVTARGVVYGKVQGVGFRAFTRKQARLHAVTGYAHNQADGSVAFALTGPRSAVVAMLQTLEVGPTLAQVSRVDVSWQPAEDMRGFEIG